MEERSGAIAGAPHYRPEIDGLRAVAIVPVLLFHAGVTGFGGGFLGVDVFFVISGYLITHVLLRDLQAGGIRFAHFYERRARRIVPALVPVLFACAAAAWWIMTAEDFRHFGRSLGAAALFGSNVWLALRSNYFAPEDSVTPLLHTWSLGVEEQFYLLFPLALAWCWRMGRRAALVAILLALSASFVAYLWLSPLRPEWAFFLLPTRLWELLLGAAAAAGPRRPLPGAAGWAGLAFIAAALAMGQSAIALPLVTLGTALVLLSAGAGGAATLLRWRSLVWLGTISYGTYLWHMPLFAFAHYRWLGPLPALATVVLLSASFALGWVSYRWIERPVRTNRLLGARKAITLFCLASLGLAAALGVAIASERIGPRNGPVQQAAGARFAGEGMSEVEIPLGGERLPFVLYGDSHARQYYPAMVARFGSGALISADGCMALPGVSNVAGDDPDPTRCRQHYGRLLTLVEQRPATVVVFAHLWDRMLWDAGGTVDGQRPTEGAHQSLARGLNRAIAALPPGTRVAVIGHVPAARPPRAPGMAHGWPRCRAYLNATCPTSYPVAQAEGAAVNRLLRAIVASEPRAVFLDPAEVLCGAATCPIVDRGKLVYSDESHVSAAYVRLVVARLARLLDKPPRALALPPRRP